MNLDELAIAIRAVSPEAVAQGFSDWLLSWKTSVETVDDLHRQGERYIGNVWFSTDAIHAQIHGLWTAFVKTTIEGIQGMTPHERLLACGLLPRFEAAVLQQERQAIYAKLLVVV